MTPLEARLIKARDGANSVARGSGKIAGICFIILLVIGLFAFFI